MKKYMFSSAVLGAVIGAAVLSTPTVTHAAVTDAQIQAEAVLTEQSIVTTLTNYLNFLQLREIQQLEIRLAKLQREVILSSAR